MRAVGCSHGAADSRGVHSGGGLLWTALRVLRAAAGCTGGAVRKAEQRFRMEWLEPAAAQYGAGEAWEAHGPSGRLVRVGLA